MSYNTAMNPELVVSVVERDKLIESEPKSTRVVAIEGPVCAGKSSLVNSLIGSGLGGILEYSEYVGHANQDFPKFPPRDAEQAKRSFEFFLDLEKQRILDMQLLTQSNVVIDRSIFTLLAFEAGASRITGIDIFDWAVERLLQEEEIILPDHVVYLDVAPQVSIQRAEENDIPIPKFLLSEEFNRGFRDFFIALSEGCT